MSPTVIHLENCTFRLRILFLFEELGIEYEIKQFARDPTTKLGPQKELEKYHPLGKSPVVISDNGTALAESGAIVEHYMRSEAGAKLRPDDKHLDLHCSLMHFAEGTLMTHAIARLYVSRLLPRDDPKTPQIMQRMVGHNLDREMQYLSDLLGEQSYFCGDRLTGADIMLVYSIDSVLTSVDRDGSRFPKLHAYRSRIQDRPAFKKAVERGGPVDFTAFTPKM